MTLTAGDSVTPVSRKFNGATVTLGLAVGATAPPEPQFWLGDGVVCGGGLAVTVTADVPAMAPPARDAPVDWDASVDWDAGRLAPADGGRARP